jgi:hypothetical protein
MTNKKHDLSEKAFAYMAETLALIALVRQSRENLFYDLTAYVG